MPRRGAAAGQILAGVVGIALIATIAAWTVIAARKPKSETSKLTFGKNDEVYFFRPVTAQEAMSVGEALQRAGYFSDQGAAVQIMKFHGATTLSFTLQDGAWDHPLTVTAFEEIGRRVAPVIGGYPIQVNLADQNWAARKSLTVGRVAFATDAVYYLGAASDVQARALGQALRQAGYLKDSGAIVTLAKDDRASIGFVVDDDAWSQPAKVTQLEQLVRRVAPAIGGLPIELRLLNSNMDARKAVLVQ